MGNKVKIINRFGFQNKGKENIVSIKYETKTFLLTLNKNVPECSIYLLLCNRVPHN